MSKQKQKELLDAYERFVALIKECDAAAICYVDFEEMGGRFINGSPEYVLFLTAFIQADVADKSREWRSSKK